jgi:hypothetical protein
MAGLLTTENVLPKILSWSLTAGRLAERFVPESRRRQGPVGSPMENVVSETPASVATWDRLGATERFHLLVNLGL